jgi:hypothetical protein
MDDFAAVVKVEFEDDTLEYQPTKGQRVVWKGRPDFSEKAVYEARL